MRLAYPQLGSAWWMAHHVHNYTHCTHIMYIIILTAGMDMLMLSDYSLMSITVLQMSEMFLEGLLFTLPACEYLMML